MATVNIKEPKIITFDFSQEKGDENNSSCIWARFNLDIENYSMIIQSDCGNFIYSWIPTPELQSFLELCANLKEDYLLDKLSVRSVVDSNSTWENLREIIEENLQCTLIENECDMDDLKNACYSSIDDRDVHDAIDICIGNTNLKNLIEDYDIWQCIQKDYPYGAKKIVQVYITHIVPAIEKYLRK